MTGIQDWVYALELGKGRRVVQIVALLLGLLTLATIYDMREYRNFDTSEAMDVAQLARNISEGKGYVTGVLRPFGLYLVQKKSGAATVDAKGLTPDIVHPPVYPMLLAGWMKIMPMDYFLPGAPKIFTVSQPEMLIAILNQVLFLLLILLTYLIGKNLFGSYVGFLASVVVSLTELLWKFSVSGLSTLLLSLIFLCSFWSLVSLERITSTEEDSQANHPFSLKKFLLFSVILGVSIGLGVLTRYSFLGFFALVLGYLIFFLPKFRLVASIIVSLIFFLITTPWFVRNYQICGNPLGISAYAVIETTLRFPDTRLQRSINPDFSKISVSDVLRKGSTNLAHITRSGLSQLGENMIAAFFFVGLLVPFRHSTLTRLKWFLVVGVMFIAGIQALTQTHLTSEKPWINSENLLVILFPAIVIFSIAFLDTLLDQYPVPFPEVRHLLAGIIIAIASFPLVLALLPPKSIPVAYPPYHPPVIQQTSNYLGTEDLLMSDIPWAVAWYGRRNCLWLTINIATDFYAINDLNKPIKAIYLTQVTTESRLSSEILQGVDFAWERFALDVILRNNLPLGFPLKHGRRDYQEFGQLLLSDRNRWAARLRSSN